MHEKSTPSSTVEDLLLISHTGGINFKWNSLLDTILEVFHVQPSVIILSNMVHRGDVDSNSIVQQTDLFGRVHDIDVIFQRKGKDCFCIK